MYEVRNVAIFCGANPGNNPVYAETAGKLAAYLGGQGIGVVYGGTDLGLMGIIANEALASGGQVTGVITEHLNERDIAHTGLTDLHVVDGMHARKEKMAALSDAFIALPGGIGTLEELFEVWAWSKMGIHRKPCGFLNVQNYYGQLMVFIDRMVADGFLWDKHYTEIARFEESPEALLSFFQNYNPPREMWADKNDAAGAVTG